MKRIMFILFCITLFAGPLIGNEYPFRGKVDRVQMEENLWSVEVGYKQRTVRQLFPSYPRHLGDPDGEMWYGMMTFATAPMRDEAGNEHVYGLIYVFNPDEAPAVFRDQREEEEVSWEFEYFFYASGFDFLDEGDLIDHRELASTESSEDLFVRLDGYDSFDSQLNWMRVHYLDDVIVISVHAMIVNRMTEFDDPTKGIEESWDFHELLEGGR